MTLDQFLGCCLGLGLVALGRLLDKYLPPSGEAPATAAPVEQPPGYEGG